MAISTNGTVLARVAGALYNTQMSNATYSEVAALDPSSLMDVLYLRDFSNSTDAVVAGALLTNLGLTSVVGLDAWVAAQLTAAGAHKGAKIVELLNGFSQMTADPIYGTAAAAFNAKVQSALALSQTPGNSGGTFTSVGVVVVENSTFALTIGIDSKVGGTGADLFIGQVGQITTLQASDALVGGSGVDTLRVVSDGASVAGVGGFTATAVEVLELQSQAIGGTQLGLENSTGLQTLRSSSSSSDIIFQNVGEVVGLEVINSVTATNLTVNYVASTVVGEGDVQLLVLDAAKLDNLTFNGAEAVEITTNSTSTVNTLNTEASTLSFLGSKGVTITNALNAAVTKVDASASAGSVAITLAAPADAAVTTTVLGGAGNDKLTVSANTGKLSLDAGAGNDTITILTNFDKSDSIGGGAGNDTLVLAAGTTITDNAGDTTSILSKVTDIETLKATSGALTVALGAKAQTAGINTISAATAGSVDVATNVVNEVATFTNALTVNLSTGADKVVNTANVGLTVNAAAASITVADTLTGGKGVDALVLTADGSTAGADLSGVTKFETVTVKAAADATLGAKVTVGSGTLAADGSTLTPTATITIDASALGEDAVATIDASANNSYEAAVITTGAGADVIIGGAGNDVIVAGGGNDDITTGAGKDNVNAGEGDDVVRVGSNLTAADTIDGGAGNDTLVVDSVTSADLANVTNVENLQFTGDLTFNANVGFTTFDLNAVSGANTLTLTTGYTNATSVTLGANDRVVNTTDAAITASLTETALADGAIVRSGKGADVLNVTADATTTAAITITTTNLSKVDTLVVKDGGDNLTGTKALAGSDISLTINSLDTALTIDASALDAGTYAADALNVSGVSATATNAETLTVDASGMSDATASSTKAINVTGGSSDDSLTGGAANDTLSGGAGNDALSGGAGNNRLDGGAGDDSITGGSGNDLILGGEGNDTFAMTGNLTGEDSVDGGAGVDTLQLAAGATNLDFLNVFNVEKLALGSDGTTTLGSYAQQAGIAQVNGTSGNDVINASSYTTGLTVVSAAGNDNLKTGSGNDVFVFSGTSELNASDTIVAGEGQDTIRLDYGTVSTLVANNGTAANVTVTLGVVTGVETIVVNDLASKNQDGAVSITFDASYGTNTLGESGAANVITIDGSALDYVKASSGTVTQETLTVNASANAGDDILTTLVNEAEAVNVTGGAGNDSLTGGGAADTLVGGSGNDDLTGNAGADSLSGGAGRDLILGGAGNDIVNGDDNADIIVGGAGADNLTGGAGPDVFGIYAQADSKTGSVDTITDFTTGSDRIYIKTAAITSGTVVLKGAASSFDTAQAMLTAADADGKGAVFVTDTSTLWVDANNDGTLNANDIQIHLPGVTALTKSDIFTDSGDLSRTNVGTRVLTDAAFAADFATVDTEDTITVYANEATTSELLTIAAEIARIDVISVADATAARDSNDAVSGGAANTLSLSSVLNASQLAAVLGKLDTGLASVVTATATGMNGDQLNALAAAAAKATVAGTVALTSSNSVAQIAALGGMTGAGAATINAVADGMTASQVDALVGNNVDAITGALVITGAATNSSSVQVGAEVSGLLTKYTGTTASAVVTGMDATDLASIVTGGAKIASVSGVAAFTSASAASMTGIFAKEAAVADDTVVATSMTAANLDTVAANIAKVSATGISGTAAFDSTVNSAAEMSAVLGNFAAPGAASATVNAGGSNATAIDADQVAVLTSNVAKLAATSITGTATLTAAQFGTLATSLVSDAGSVVTVTGTSAELAAIVTGTSKELADSLNVDGASAGVLSLTATQAALLPSTGVTLGSGDSLAVSGQVGANTLAGANINSAVTVVYTDGAQASTVVFADMTDPTSLAAIDTFTVTNADVITGFNTATDKIDLSLFGLSGAAQVTDFTTNYTVLRDDSYALVKGSYVDGLFTVGTGNQEDWLVLWDSNIGSGVGAVNMVGVVIDNSATTTLTVANLILA
jgi:Ca2+-binding RTX toxin-like protein